MKLDKYLEQCRKQNLYVGDELLIKTVEQLKTKLPNEPESKLLAMVRYSYQEAEYFDGEPTSPETLVKFVCKPLGIL
jgi:hypothetical protein